MKRSLPATGFFCIACWLYYGQFFGGAVAAGLAVLFTALITGTCYVGYSLYRGRAPFPVVRALTAIAVFSLLRWALVYFVLQHRLAPETIFHYPRRVWWFILPTTAALLVIAYGWALYRDRSDGGWPSDGHPPSDGPTTSSITFRAGGSDIVLPLAELLHVQARGEYLIYRCADRQYTRYQRLKEAATELAAAGFVRTHRSHLVARSAIREYTATEVELTDGTRVPVSRTYRKEVAASD